MDSKRISDLNKRLDRLERLLLTSADYGRSGEKYKRKKVIRMKARSAHTPFKCSSYINL